MPNLNDSQLLVLSDAAKRDDRSVMLPLEWEEKTAAKTLKSLIKKRLLEELPATNGFAVFRRDAEGSPIALRMTDAGLAAIGVEPESSDVALNLAASEKASSSAKAESIATSKIKKRSSKQLSSEKPKRAMGSAKTSAKAKASKGFSGKSVGSRSTDGSEPRSGSKQARLIALLQNKHGANITSIVKATGWLPHTARAAISGLRKQGYRIEVERKERGKGTYRILAASKRKSAGKGSK